MRDDPMKLLSRHIDVWLAFYQDFVDESLLSSMRALLSDAERCQEKRFYFADDRQRYLVTRAMVRSVLSRYAGGAPADWVFSANAYGRPAIANASAAARGLSFNISHARGLIALGVTRRRALGVDVENVLARPVSIGIAERFFSRSEVAELARVPADLRQDRFFEYWTFKESYIKARGMGLSIPLDRFSFDFPQERSVRISIDAELNDDEKRWDFWQLRPTPEHLLALCAARLDAESTVLTVRKMTSLAAVEVLDLPLLKAPALSNWGGECPKT